MPPKICQLKIGENNCAHQLSKAFGNMFPKLMDGDGKHFCEFNGFMRCGCGAAVRAKQIRDWAMKNFSRVQKLGSTGTYIVFEYNNIEGGGHIWGVYHNKCYGNGYYNGYTNKEFKNQEIYKVG